MAERWDQDQVWRLIVLGLGWWLCVALWTASLLTTYPAQIGRSVTPASLHFPAAKCLHISAYAFLALYLKWLPLGRWRWLLLAFLSLHGAGTEFFQQYVPTRQSRLLDVFVDHIGLMLGMAATWKCWLPRYFVRQKAECTMQN